VLLSYECYQPKFTQAKAIIGMPRIMRLCDDVMACEQPAHTHGTWFLFNRDIFSSILSVGKVTRSCSSPASSLRGLAEMDVGLATSQSLSDLYESHPHG